MRCVNCKADSGCIWYHCDWDKGYGCRIGVHDKDEDKYGRTGCGLRTKTIDRLLAEREEKEERRKKDGKRRSGKGKYRKY